MSSLDRKYCSACQTFKPLEGGLKKQMKSGSRWLCQPCAARTMKNSKEKRHLCAA